MLIKLDSIYLLRSIDIDITPTDIQGGITKLLQFTETIINSKEVNNRTGICFYISIVILFVEFSCLPDKIRQLAGFGR